MKTFREWVNENFDDNPFGDLFGGADEPDNSAQHEEQARAGLTALHRGLEGLESVAMAAKDGYKTVTNPQTVMQTAMQGHQQLVQGLEALVQTTPMGRYKQALEVAKGINLKAIAGNLQAIQQVKANLPRF